MAGIVHKTGWVLAGVVSLLAIAAVARIVYGGPLDPPAAPGPTDATVITALPYTISAPGKYVLKGNLATATTGISVTASDVTIDLNGFALIGPGTGCPDGISSSGAPIKNLVVRNGTIRDWCHSGIAVVTGSGALFDDLRLTGNGTSPVAALSFTRGNANNCIVEANGHAGIEMGGGTISHCDIRGNGEDGIIVDSGIGTVIRDCVVSGNGTNSSFFNAGIELAGGAGVTLSGCTINNNVGAGISAGSGNGVISGNSVAGNGGATSSPGIDIGSNTTVTGNTVGSNGADGIRVGGSGNYISENNLAGNTNSGVYISPTGGNTRVDGNAISGGQWGVYVDGTHNTVVRNSVAGVAQLRYFIGGTNNVAGPEQGLSPAPALANPWANIDE